MHDYKYVAFRIKVLNNQIRRLIEQAAGKVNNAELTGVQHATLGFIRGRIHEGEVPVYQKDIEAEFNIRRSTASAMVGQLEELGYICRESDPSDARLKRITLTEKTEEMEHSFIKMIEYLQYQLTEGIPDEELQQFYSTMDKIAANANK